ncbi:uncharacterized protein LOC131440657 isoform X4 [Malaya genurostris]|uniref:uncharacterized protein LOC131440657 isoform X4 n=1 Tax=Malaya genurostris TaxID=325434 RepID=UPI0026F38026|nr:uncharacterized protein LOC131440657 isoform X4 [Malaya genurostris]
MQVLIVLVLFCIAKNLSLNTDQNINVISNNTRATIRRNSSGRPRIIKHLIGEEVVFDSDLYQRLRKNLKNSNSSEYNYYKNNVSWNPSNVNTGLKKANISDNKKIENGKTLADQVVEGKYGLIHNELFRTTPHRPGVLSYIHNIEIPQDDAANFGGLNKKEIWLSEGHLLVLNGGRVNEHFNGSKWKAIDSFSAPLRQVKIPLNPKIPPPFPIQLTDDGPIHFVGRIQIPFCSQFLNDSLCVFPNDVTQGNNFSATNSTKSNKTKKNEKIQINQMWMRTTSPYITHRRIVLSTKIITVIQYYPAL